MSDKKYTVGQKLWWVPPHSQYNQPPNGGYEATVTKVGVKYVTVSWAFENSKWPMERVFNKSDGYEKSNFGHHNSGRAWIAREAHEEHVRLRHAWMDLCKLAAEKLQRHRSPPSDLTMSEIETITGILETLA